MGAPSGGYQGEVGGTVTRPSRLPPTREETEGNIIGITQEK